MVAELISDNWVNLKDGSLIKKMAASYLFSGTEQMIFAPTHSLQELTSSLMLLEFISHQFVTLGFSIWL